MRIGIITQPLIVNYGGILQNYALQQVLIRLGHKPITIDLLPPQHRKDKIKHYIRALIHLRWPDKWDSPYKRKRIINRFIFKHIKTTFPVRKYSGAIVKLYRFDTIIAGSDQIWRPMYNEYYADHLYDGYFKFVESSPVGKIVYAASFGTDEWEYSQEQTETCRLLIHKAYAGSVRERNGVELCRQYFGIEAQWVLDPTMLLDIEEYERLCAHIPRAEQSFIAVYLLDVDEILTDRVKELARELELPLRFFSVGEIKTLSIEEWLAMFRDATYVITDSFHGTVFSIIFNRPFISIGNSPRGMSRFLSLLEQFGLEKRLSPEISAEILLRPISWEGINERKDAWKEKSMRFLEQKIRTNGKCRT